AAVGWDPAHARARAAVAGTRGARAAPRRWSYSGWDRIRDALARRAGVRRLPVSGRDPMDLGRRLVGRVPGDAREAERPRAGGRDGDPRTWRPAGPRRGATRARRRCRLPELAAHGRARRPAAGRPPHGGT